MYTNINCSKKSYLNLKLLYPHRQIMNKKTKITLCESVILSHFNYADTLYGPCITVASSRRIQKVQNSCLSFIYGIRRRNRISYKLKDANWLSMMKWRSLHLACLVYNIIIFGKPPYLYNKIRFRTDVHNINVRNRGNVTIPNHRTEMFKRAFSYQVAVTYNKLATPYFQLLKLSLFPKAVFTYLMSNWFSLVYTFTTLSSWNPSSSPSSVMFSCLQVIPHYALLKF